MDGKSAIHPTGAGRGTRPDGHEPHFGTPAYLIGSATGRIGAASAPRNFSEAPMKANS